VTISRAVVQIHSAGESVLASLTAHEERAAAARFAAWLSVAGDAFAENTKRAIARDLRTYVRWCHAQQLPVMPADMNRLERYLTDLIGLGRKRATVERALYTVSLVHKGAGYPDPADNPLWKITWKKLKKRLSKAQSQAYGLSSGEVDKMMQAMGNSLHDLRDAALLMVAADTLCRRSELAAMCREHMEHDARARSWSVVIPFSKTDQEGEGMIRYVSPEAHAAVARWCKAAGIVVGPLFRAIGGRPRADAEERRRLSDDTFTDTRRPIAQIGDALTPTHIARIFKQRARAAGIDASRVSGHSLRVGTAQDLGAAGADVRAIAAAGGWKSLRMVIRYTEKQNVARGAVAKLRRAAPLTASLGGGPGGKRREKK